MSELNSNGTRPYHIHVIAAKCMLLVSLYGILMIWALNAGVMNQENIHSCFGINADLLQDAPSAIFHL